MQENYIKALNGTLCSTKTGSVWNELSLVNNLPIPLTISIVGYSGRHRAPHKIPANGETSANNWNDGHYAVVNSAYTGGLVTVVKPTANNETMTIKTTDLTLPNDIGPIPQATPAMWIPPNTPRTVVGVGTIPNQNNLVIREQYWELQPSSLSLAANEIQTATYTVTSGKSTTSSTQESITTAVSASAGGGWGAVSASVSASLSASASATQQVTVSEQDSSYHSKKFENGDKAAMYLMWQLMDVVTIIEADNGDPKGSIVTAVQPTIVQGPYYPTPPSKEDLENQPPAYKIMPEPDFESAKFTAI